MLSIYGISVVTPLYLQRPCCAVLPVASQCKGTRYLLARDAQYYSMRPCIHCAVCQLPWSSHPRGKHIPKDCKFHHRQVQGEPGEDEPGASRGRGRPHEAVVHHPGKPGH